MFDRAALDRLFRYSFALTADEADAGDLLQDALERFLKSPVVKLNPEAYIRTIIKNRFIDRFRQRQRFRVEPFEETTYVDFDISTLEQTLINENELETVWRILDATEREILFYWALEDMSTSEIAKTMGKPRGTILSRIYRLRQKVKQWAETGRAGNA